MSLNSILKELDGLEFEFQGGVDQGAVDKASEQLGLVFPPSYTEFLRLYGCGYIAFQELMGLGGSPHLDVVAQALRLRQPSKRSRFPESFIPILADGFGNYECIDTASVRASGESPVVQWLHDGGDDQAFMVIAGSYEEWLRETIRQVRSVEADGGDD